jgi:hypothetical protein
VADRIEANMPRGLTRFEIEARIALYDETLMKLEQRLFLLEQRLDRIAEAVGGNL